jgi:hypothetical protein
MGERVVLYGKAGFLPSVDMVTFAVCLSHAVHLYQGESFFVRYPFFSYARRDVWIRWMGDGMLQKQ